MSGHRLEGRSFLLYRKGKIFTIRFSSPIQKKPTTKQPRQQKKLVAQAVSWWVNT